MMLAFLVGFLVGSLVGVLFMLFVTVDWRDDDDEEWDEFSIWRG